MALNIIDNIRHTTNNRTKVNKKDIVKAKDDFTKPTTNNNTKLSTTKRKNVLNKIKPHLESKIRKELSNQKHLNKYSDKISDTILKKLDISSKLSPSVVLKGPISMSDKINNLFKSECDKDGQTLLDSISDSLNDLLADSAGKGAGCDPTPNVIKDVLDYTNKLPLGPAKRFIRSFLTNKATIAKISAIGNTVNNVTGSVLLTMNNSVKLVDSAITAGTKAGVKTLTTATANNLLKYLKDDKLKDSKRKKDSMAGIKKLVDKVNKSKPKPPIDVKPLIDDKTIITYA